MPGYQTSDTYAVRSSSWLVTLLHVFISKPVEEDCLSGLLTYCFALHQRSELRTGRGDAQPPRCCLSPQTTIDTTLETLVPILVLPLLPLSSFCSYQYN